MYKKIIFLIGCTFSSHYGFSQNSSPTASNPAPPKIITPDINYRNQDFTAQLSMIDPRTGRSFKNIYPDVNGFPFFIEDWKYSLIKLADGRKFDMIRTKLNLYTKELHFKTNNDVEMAFPGGYVREVNVYGSPESNNIIYKFKTGFPKIDNQDQNTYYQVLCTGKATLLKLTRKQITVNKNDLSGEVKKQFEAYEDYYVFSNEQMKSLKKEKKFILNTLSDKKDEIEVFVKKNTTNFKSVNDIADLFTYYNSLF
ncbi:MAG TPA: hypothetical protein VGP43_02900 [Chitinophagaceae bacterium]|nr:hypothetical protein [Chitinophagaceae bacterium]